MQLAQEQKKVVRSNQFQESKFKIEASSKAFQILSSRLYADGFKAIIRELCTNASDAHVAAGIPNMPIHVHCPSLFDGSFSVRDFGTGIDPQDFEKIYTTYFYSTKSDTNDQVGCFGLGSKSPFAYTQQFTVENHFGGKKYIYSCFINESGEPSVTLLSTVATDETGVKISFPVKREDWYEFERAAMKVLQWFDVDPKCNVKFVKAAFIGRIKKFGYGEAVDHPQYGVRMGQVVYPVKNEYLEDYCDNGTIINVHVGAVDITPSRESLEYSKRTIDTLEKIKAELSVKFNADVKAIMHGSGSIFSKFVALHKYMNENGTKTNLKNSTIATNFPNSVSNSFYVLSRIDEKKFTNKIAQYTKSNWRQKLERSYDYMSITDKSIFLIKDKSVNISAKIMQLLNGKSSYNVIVIPKDEKDNFLKFYPCVKIEDCILASEYELDSNSQAYTTTRTSTNCCKAAFDSDGTIKKVGTKIDKTVTSGLFMYENEFSSIIGGFKYSNFRKYYESKGSPTLYIFTHSQYNQLKISSRNFTNFMDGIVKELTTNKQEVIDSVAADIVISRISHSKAMLIGEKTKADNGYKKYYELHSNASYDSSKAGYYEGMCELIRWHNRDFYHAIKTDIENRATEYAVHLDEANKKYPLVDFALDSTKFCDIMDSVIEYVDMMENKGE